MLAGDHRAIVVWSGYAMRSCFSAEELEVRDDLAGAARDGRWESVFEHLRSDRRDQLVNSVRPGSRSGFTPLHQAAYRGDEAAAQELLARGAYPSVRTTGGERAIDIAARRGFPLLARVFAPRRQVDD